MKYALSFGYNVGVINFNYDIMYGEEVLDCLFESGLKGELDVE